MKRLDVTIVFCKRERVSGLQRQFLGFFQVFGEAVVSLTWSK
jgi:hypothetical protein